MTRSYTKSEIRKNRKSLKRWSKSLLISGVTCLYLFTCTKPENGFPWILLITGLVCILFGLAGLLFLDMTESHRTYCYY